jgi:hypothetical protein
MIRAASLLLLAGLLAGGCSLGGPKTPARPTTGTAATSDPLPTGALLPSHNLRVGRVLAVDPPHGIAVIDLALDAPATALVDGAPLVTRTNDLRETARLTASRYRQGRTLGAKIVSGQPSPGDEVVFPAP